MYAVDMITSPLTANGSGNNPISATALLVVLLGVPQGTIGNPCPVLDSQTATVWIGFTRNNQRALVTKSTDVGRTWTTPTETTDTVKPKNWNRYWTGPGHGLQLSGGAKAGRLIFPSYHIVDEGDRRVMRSHMIYSDDHGAT